MSDDFSDLLTAFVAQGVEFLVVGAHALAAHGVPRVTGDLDLWVNSTQENASRVWKALGQFGAPLDSLQIRESDFHTRDVVAQFGLPPFRVDIMTTISGVEWQAAWADRLSGKLFGVRVAFLGKESFIRNKRASGRDKDLRDLRALDGES